MSADDFEKKLQRQPLRRVPDDWRGEILRNARAEAGRPENGPLVRAGLKVWQELILPCRRAWAGLAAVWLLIWGINAGLSSGPGPSPAMRTATAPAALETLKEQRRVLAELIPPADNQPADAPRRTPQPRSDRRRIEFSTV